MSAVLADLLEAFPPVGGWVERAARGDLAMPEVFVADRRPNPEDLAVAERVCRRCPVRADCTGYALSAPVWGFWGGVWHNGKARSRPAARQVEAA